MPCQGHCRTAVLLHHKPCLHGANLYGLRNFVPCKHSIWIAIRIILIPILGG